MANPLDDIIPTLYRLRLAFRQHDIPLPDQLSFSNVEDAARANRALRYALSRKVYMPTFYTDPRKSIELDGFTFLFEPKE